MSANNWTTCRRCEAKAIKTRDKLEEAAAKAYGKVPPEEYKKLVDESRSVRKIEPSLREDWEIYSEDWKLVIHYGCSCEVCGYEFSYNKKIDMPD